MEEHPVTYLCDWIKHGKCDNSPICRGNGGTCWATTCICYALKNHKGEPVKSYFYKEDSSNEN